MKTHTLNLIRALALMLAALLPMSAVQANHFEDNCTRSDGKPIGTPIHLYATINIGRDVQVGEAYGPWISHEVIFTCTRTPVLHAGSTWQPANDYFEVKTAWTATDADNNIPPLFAADPNYRVYRSYGVGFIARMTEYIEGHPPQTTPFNKVVGAYTTTTFTDNYARQANDVSRFHRRLEIRLVKLAANPGPTHLFYPVTAKFFTQTRKPPKHGHGTDTTVWKQHPDYTYYLNTTRNSIAAACITPNVNVPLGTTYTASLQNGGAGPLKDFSLRFEQCPQGLTAIDYRLRAVPQQPVTSGVLPLVAQPESASGVGVQVLEADGATPVTFDAWRHLNAYDPTQPDATYEVPLKARIKRTSGTLEGGQVKALMEMEVKYK